MVAWAGLIGAALFGRAAAQVGLWQTLAGYQTASDVNEHAKIDLDMDELENFVGNYDSTDGTETTWRSDALFVYENGATGQQLLVARLDNLGKGASGAAVQNLNLMLGLPEQSGL